MRTILFVTAAALALTGCNQGVSLTNATPEEAAKAMKDQGITGLAAGEWETTIQVLEAEMPGLPKASAEKLSKASAEMRKHSYCITPEEAAKPGGSFLTGDKSSKCNVEKLEMNGGRIEQIVSCPDPDGKPGMRMSTSGTYTSTTMDGTAQMEMGGFMKMKVKLSSRRVGECKAESAK
jgi:hypothetical protein